MAGLKFARRRRWATVATAVEGPHEATTATDPIALARNGSNITVFGTERGGAVRGVLAELQDVLARAPEGAMFAIGHGAPFGRAELSSCIGMVEASIDFVAAEKAAGKSLAEIQGGDKPQGWANWESELVPATEWVKMIYDTI